MFQPGMSTAACNIVDAFKDMSFQARNLHRGADIYTKMLKDENCSVWLTQAGSYYAAGCKEIVVDMIEHNMLDVIVSTGALIVDMDFFEALGFKHYKGTSYGNNDMELASLHVDRIYDTYIDEDDLRVCDETIQKICDSLESRPYTSREFIWEMGKYLVESGSQVRSVVKAAYEHNVPIFCPAFSDCSAGFGFLTHQTQRQKEGKPYITIDSAGDFKELTEIKVNSKETGLLMVGGGVSKNFAQDTVVGADILGVEAKLHKYAVQITVADERDGSCSSSTLKEAQSWGKVDDAYEQMVFAEATIAFPLMVGYAFTKLGFLKREAGNKTLLFKK